MWFTNRLGSRRGKKQCKNGLGSPGKKYPRHGYQPRLEHLEDRTLLDANFSQLPAAFDTLLPAMQNAVNHDVYMSTTIPLLGQQLQTLPSGTQFLTDKMTGIQKVLDADIVNPQSAQDVVADFMTNASNVFSDLKLDLGKSSITLDTTNSNDVKFTVTMVSQPVALQPLMLNIGLKNLGLNLGTVTIPATLQYTVNLDFGVTDTDVYLSTARNPVVQFCLSLPLTIPNSGLSFGPLSISVVGQPGTPSVTFNVAFNGPNQSNQVFVQHDLVQGNYDLTANSALTLGGADLKFSLPISLAVSNFSVGTTVALDWPITVQNDQISVANPTVSLNDITLDLKTFTSLTGPLQSLADDINKVLAPMAPFANFLSQEVPILSQLSGLISTVDKQFPNQKLTMAALFDYMYDAQQGTTGKPAEDFLGLYNALQTIANLFTPQGAQIDFGSYTFGNFDDSQSLANLTPSGLPDLNNVENQISSTIGTVITDLNDTLKAIFKDINDQNIKLSLTITAPIFDDPINNMLKLILGQDVGLIQVDFEANLSYSDDLPFIPILGPLGVQIKAALEFDAKLVMGYDTYGLDTGNLGDGFYIDPTTDAKLTANVTADAAVDLPLVELGGGGGITGTLDFPIASDANIIGPLGGGKVRLSNVTMALSHGPLCIFDPNGSVTVSLNVFAKVGVDPFSVTFTKDLGSETIASFNLGCSLATMTQPVLAGRGDWTYDPNTNEFNPNPNNSQPGVLYLDMGPYASDRGLKVWNGGKDGWNGDTSDDDESFTVTYVSTQQDGSETVDVSNSGYIERYTGVTEIVAEGGLGNNTVRIDPNIKVDVALFGSVNPFDLPNLPPLYQNYLTDPDFAKSHNILQAGGGTSFLEGGQGTDQLIGGTGANFIVGGQSQATIPNDELLIGGTGPNQVEAGFGGTNTLVAGPQDGDLEIGGKSTLNNDIFIAGAGADTMYGGDGNNTYEWQEGNGPLTIHGGPSLNNYLQAIGVTAGGSFEIKHGMTLPLEVDFSAPSGNANTPPKATTINADTVQTTSVDDLGDGTTYTIQDLAGTGVNNVSANLHEASGASGSPDTIQVYGSKSAVNTVVVSANPNVLAGNPYDAQGNKLPAVYGQATNVDLTIAGDDFAGLPGARYVVTAAIPKTSDMLTINTGIANDTVSVESTQGAVSDNSDPGDGPPNLGGSVYVNTIAGNNTINVGTTFPGQGVGLLDRIQGNLIIDAGIGTQNQLNVDESNAVNGDTLALTALHGLKGQKTHYQILRYFGEDLAANPDGGVAGFTTVPPPQPEPQRYSMLIQYDVDTNVNGSGAYGAGVNLYLTRAPDLLYVTDTMPGAPTTIYTDGNQSNLNPKDQITVGFNPLDIYTNAKTAPQSTLDYLDGPLDVEGTGDTDLQVYDESPQPFAAEYVITANEVSRTVLALPIVITYHFLGEPNFTGDLELFATNAPNSIFVRSTAKDTTTTVNTGTATSSILVGQLLFPYPFPPLYSLDAIQGALDIVGGGGSDSLNINDDGNTSGYTYLELFANLTDLLIQRIGQIPNAPIQFSGMATMDLYEPSQQNINTVSGTAAGTTSTIHTGDANDGLNVTTLDQIKGPLDFVFDPTKGTKSLTVSDQTAAAADTYTLSADANMLNPPELDRTGAAPIQFNQPALIELFPGKNAMVYIPRINTNTTVEVFAGAGPSSVIVASDKNNNSQDLTAIQGQLFVQGSQLPQSSTSVLLEDQNALAGRTYSLYSDHFLLGGQPQPVSFSNLSGLILDSGSLGNQTNVYGTASGNFVRVNAGTNDKITVSDSSETLQGIVGPLFVMGVGTGDNLILDDTKGLTGSTYTIMPIEVDDTHTAPPLSVKVGYNHLANLSVMGSAGGDFYKVVGVAPPIHYQVTGGGVANVLSGPNSNSIWNIIGPNSGRLNANLDFTDMQNLLGGSATDLFAFQKSGSLAGTLDGGGGTNTLNYAGYLGNVTVDLPLHLASLVNKMNPNSVFNIQNVQGSNGNDVIVGDANPNVFVGGTGRNLIIGGNGSDNIIGGGGDNILISGTTLWDANLPDLMLIMHEWMRMDLTFRQRVVDILTGGIIVPKNVPASVLKGTGVNLLPEISVLPDAPAAPDTLAGGAGQNWFFFDFDDIITNFKTGPNGDIRLLD